MKTSTPCITKPIRFRRNVYVGNLYFSQKFSRSKLDHPCTLRSMKPKSTKKNHKLLIVLNARPHYTWNYIWL